MLPCTTEVTTVAFFVVVVGGGGGLNKIDVVIMTGADLILVEGVNDVNLVHEGIEVVMVVEGGWHHNTHPYLERS